MNGKLVTYFMDSPLESEQHLKYIYSLSRLVKKYSTNKEEAFRFPPKKEMVKRPWYMVPLNSHPYKPHGFSYALSFHC